MENWIKYKDNIINLAQIQGFSVEKIPSKRDGGAVAAYTDDLKPDKQKPWMLMAGHQGIEVFKTKPEALKLAVDIVKGKYDI